MVNISVMDEYSEVFNESELATIPGEVKLYTNKLVTPSVACPRRVPINGTQRKTQGRAKQA